jgi:hypothetical protein
MTVQVPRGRIPLASERIGAGSYRFGSRWESRARSAPPGTGAALASKAFSRLRARHREFALDEADRKRLVYGWSDFSWRDDIVVGSELSGCRRRA